MAMDHIALAASALCALTATAQLADDKIDISPFALPNTASNEVWFEDPRNIERLVVTFRESAPSSVSVSYLKKTWPEFRPEVTDPTYDSMRFGWRPIDDHFNSKWKQAAAKISKLADNVLEITFEGLATEFPEAADYDVKFRRTLAVRIDVPNPSDVKKIEVYTTANVKTSEILVTLDAGKPTQGGGIALSAYNARIDAAVEKSGVRIEGAKVRLGSDRPRSFLVKLTHLIAGGLFSYDEGLVTFELDHDAFTISLDALEKQGPIWYEEEGVFIKLADDPTTFDEYIESNKDKRTTAQMVKARREQSLGSPVNAQPRPHPCAGSLGCKHCIQRFWVEPNLDIVLHRDNIHRIRGADTKRFKNRGNGRLFLGLEHWTRAGRFLEPGPVLISNAGFKRGDVRLDTQALAVPLSKSISADLAGDETIICLIRIIARNTGSKATSFKIPISYSNDSHRNRTLISRNSKSASVNDWQVPKSEREQLSLRELAKADASGFPLIGIMGDYEGEQVLRCAAAGNARFESQGSCVSMTIELGPGEERELFLKVPYIGLDEPEEIAALASLDFTRSREDVRRFWQEECDIGAHVCTPEPMLDEFYRGHLAFVEISDTLMPGETDLINTSVGTSTYGNFTNESAMIIEELDERGLHDMARQRLNVWLKYQGTAPLKGAFTDHDGVFYGAGGYESGDSYCQHHGWALWCLAKHYFLTGDRDWLAGIADKLVKGVDWVARQRKLTLNTLPHSRGWERGWLAPGGLEDVDDYFYWLSTNTMTYRGVEYVARALEDIGHAEAARVRKEADDYRAALIAGFETARKHCPIVRLKDGRWVPYYPSRLYRRGRDLGWIREILEGAVYLFIGELYGPDSRQAQWVLDDYLDNRYLDPKFGYPVYQVDRNWFDYGGFSQQPCLLPGLMPHLDRDEPEVYIWMFFNSFAATYREEVGGLIEHPHPILGFSNQVAYKTSDEANAVKWLRYMYVYSTGSTLHLGRAIPREWLADGNDISATDVATPFGKVSVQYKSSAASGTITAEVDFDQRRQPDKLLVRFRHPDKQRIHSVAVNGREHTRFDAETENVDISGMSGRVEIVVRYEQNTAGSTSGSQ